MAVVGDSITVLSAPGVVGELDGYAVYVRAEDGKRMDQMLPALGQEVRRHPEAIVINLGTNDAVQAQTHPDWLTGFDAAWDLVRSERCVVFVTVNTYADKIGRERVAFGHQQRDAPARVTAPQRAHRRLERGGARRRDPAREPEPPARRHAAADAPPICPLGGCTTDAAHAAAPPGASCAGAGGCVAAAKAACADAQPLACTRRGLQLWGQGISSSLPFVVALFARACDLGDAEACHYGGRMVLDGKGVPRDVAAGEAMLAKACDADRAQACLILAAHFTSSDAAPKQQRYQWTAICLRGNGDACAVLGIDFHKGEAGIGHDDARSAHYFDLGCRQGQASACSWLGRAYASGNGVSKDLARAAELFDVACRRADNAGCAALGASVEYGDAGGAPDMTRAADLYARGCSLSLAYACIRGDMLGEYRRGVPHDPARAAAQWTSQCDHADGPACAFLGVLTLDGRGVAEDPARAAELMRKACRASVQPACTWVRQNDE